MRIHLEKNKGYLTCKDSKGQNDVITIPFELDTLLDWYPLSVNYEYRYDQATGEFFLAPSEYSHPNKYGITKRRRNSSVGGASFKPDWMFVPEVYEENMKVVLQGNDRDFPIFGDEDTTLTDVEDLHSKLTEDVDAPIKEAIIQRAFENMAEDEWIKYYRVDEEVQDTILYKYATDEEVEKLYESGSLRVYLNLMRKMVYANGV